jgi:hypothetical protein
MFDRLWYRRRGVMHPWAAHVACAGEDYLRSERTSLNVPAPEVEEQVQALATGAAPALQWLRTIEWRHVCAINCDRFDSEHPITNWIRTLSDSAVMALIRENSYWLRNAALADRICRRRLDLLTGDDTARAFLGQLLSPGSRPSGRHRPTSGPQFAPSMLCAALEMAQAQARADQVLWGGVREAATDHATWREVGAAFLRRVDGGDAPYVLRLTSRQVISHLGRHLVIVRPANEDRTRWVCIDDPGWPRASAVALLAARWKVSKGWMLKKLRPEKP